MERPIARGAEPFRSFRLSSVAPKTTRTRMKVMINSTPKAWPTDTFELTTVIPKFPVLFVDVIP